MQSWDNGPLYNVEWTGSTPQDLLALTSYTASSDVSQCAAIQQATYQELFQHFPGNIVIC